MPGAPCWGARWRGPDPRIALAARWNQVRLCLERTELRNVAAPEIPTTPGTAALLGALGCREGMMLDGGLSAQLLARDEARREQRRPGSRQVPLALLASPIP